MGNSLESTRILDAAAGSKGIWYQKNHPFVTFIDNRYIRGDKQKTKHKIADRRIIRIQPDIICEWQHLPFRDCCFDMIVFDPPHLVRPRMTDHIFIEKYGLLYSSNYQSILKLSFIELFRVLKEEGILILKWNECDKPVENILKVMPYKPLFGTRLGKNHKTHWITFIKYRPEKTLEAFQSA